MKRMLCFIALTFSLGVQAQAGPEDALGIQFEDAINTCLAEERASVTFCANITAALFERSKVKYSLEMDLASDPAESASSEVEVCDAQWCSKYDCHEDYVNSWSICEYVGGYYPGDTNCPRCAT